jgi:hypothetical protein
MDIIELGLTAVSQAALEAAGLTNVEDLVRHPADDLFSTTAHIGPFELFEIVCRLSEHGYSLPPVKGGATRVADERNREALRLRIIEGLTLSEVANQIGITTERVRQILRAYFGLRITPPATQAARQRRRRAT